MGDATRCCRMLLHGMGMVLLGRKLSVESAEIVAIVTVATDTASRWWRSDGASAISEGRCWLTEPSAGIVHVSLVVELKLRHVRGRSTASLGIRWVHLPIVIQVRHSHVDGLADGSE